MLQSWDAAPETSACASLPHRGGRRLGGRRRLRMAKGGAAPLGARRRSGRRRLKSVGGGRRGEIRNRVRVSPLLTSPVLTGNYPDHFLFLYRTKTVIWIAARSRYVPVLSSYRSVLTSPVLTSNYPDHFLFLYRTNTVIWIAARSRFVPVFEFLPNRSYLPPFLPVTIQITFFFSIEPRQ